MPRRITLVMTAQRIQSEADLVKAPPIPVNQARRPDYQRIARELRQQIIAGEFAAGSRLPSTAELAGTFRSSVYTVHTALASLAKEGWIERIHGAGTYVAQAGNRFTCAGIYHESDIGSSHRSNFVRSIHDCLLEQCAALNKETRIFVDSRPADKRGTLLPALAEAIQNREIQCVIAPTATFEDSPALSELAVPTAYAGNPMSLNRVDFDKAEFIRDGVRCLARQGCRSIGMMSPPLYWREADGDSEFFLSSTFNEFIREEGLRTQPEWISVLDTSKGDQDAVGYETFRKVWKLREAPEGLIVFPDMVARGVITAALVLGIDVVPSKMKFVFHRNAHNDLLCPFPVTWAISDEAALAKKLLQIIEKQFRGETVSPILLPYELQADDAARWR